jgi:hypothetical protein
VALRRERDAHRVRLVFAGCHLSSTGKERVMLRAMFRNSLWSDAIFFWPDCRR